MADLRNLAEICDESEKEKCRAEFGENLDWACNNCPKQKGAEIGPYTAKLLMMRSLRLAGYPLKANDLTLDEWLDLGMMETWLQMPQKSHLS